MAKRAMSWLATTAKRVASRMRLRGLQEETWEEFLDRQW
jgi:hypothetical protein